MEQNSLGFDEARRIRQERIFKKNGQFNTLPPPLWAPHSTSPSVGWQTSRRCWRLALCRMLISVLFCLSQVWMSLGSRRVSLGLWLRSRWRATTLTLCPLLQTPRPSLHSASLENVY